MSATIQQCELSLETPSLVHAYVAARQASLLYICFPSKHNLIYCTALATTVVEEMGRKLASSSNLAFPRFPHDTEREIHSSLYKTGRIMRKLTEGYKSLMGVQGEEAPPEVRYAFFDGALQRLICASVWAQQGLSCELPPSGLTERFCLTTPINSYAEAPLAPPFEYREVESVARALEAFCQSQETIYLTKSRPVPGSQSIGEQSFRRLYNSVQRALETCERFNPGIRVPLESLSLARGSDPNDTGIDARVIFQDDDGRVQERALAGAGLVSTAFRLTARTQQWRDQDARSVELHRLKQIYRTAEDLMQAARTHYVSAWEME